MKLNVQINIENTGIIDNEMKTRIEEIVGALISSGGLTGVKGGQTIIHFDAGGYFQGVQLSYWPFRRRKQE